MKAKTAPAGDHALHRAAACLTWPYNSISTALQCLLPTPTDPLAQLQYDYTLSKDQKSKISIHGGYVLSTHYPEALPMWTDIGTDVKQTLLKDLVKRLGEQQCSD